MDPQADTSNRAAPVNARKRYGPTYSEDLPDRQTRRKGALHKADYSLRQSDRQKIYVTH